MVSEQQVKILIEAQENVSKVAKKAEDALSKLGSVGSKAMNSITNVSSKVQSAFSKLGSYVDRAREKFNSFKNSSDKLGMIKNAISNVATSFGELINGSNLAANAMEKIKSVSDGIQTKFTNLKSNITNFGSSVKTSLTNAFSLTNIKEKFSSLGSSIDSLKAKIKSLSTETKGLNGSFGFLKSALSMTVGMVGYDLFNSFMQAGRAAINAQGQLEYFGKRLNLSSQQTSSFNKYIDDMQKQFRKVNMKAVGASAEEMAVKLNLGAGSIKELTKVTAVMSSAFVKEGRSQEDAILAVSDALDGQFRRLQELGISEEMLKNNGWSGDLADKNGLLKAMNKTLDEMGFTKTAQDITSLDDAFQALSVAGGDLLASILIPLTPILVGIMEAAIGAMDGIKGFISSLQSGWGNLPEWAQIAIGIAAVALAVGIAIAAFGGLEAVILALAGPIASFIGVITAISWPIVAVVAAIGLLVAAIYEIGKAFGWWKDVGTMFEAIANNVHRLWDAFINHPDVQAAISAISGALEVLGGWISYAWGEILKFFGVSSSSNWDVTRSIIEAIGLAWDFLSFRIRAAIFILQGAWGVLSWLVGIAVGVGQAIYNALKPIVCILLGCSPGIVPALQKVQEVFSSVWNAIAGFIGGVIGGIISALQPIIDVLTMIGEFLIGQFMESWNALVEVITIVWNSVSMLVTIFQQFMDGQISLTTALTMVWNVISSMFLAVLQIIIQNVISFGSSLVNLAINIGGSFVSNIISFISQLPGRFLNYLTSVKLQIMVQMAYWVTLAKQKASELINGILSFLSQLPAKALAQLVRVVASIVSAGAQWVSNAKSKASEIVSGVVGILSGLAGRISGALSGVVNAITQPFRSAYDGVVNIVNNLKNKVQEGLDYIGQLGGAAGGEVMAAGGEIVTNHAVDLISGDRFDITTGEIVPVVNYESEPEVKEVTHIHKHESEPVEVNINESIILDLVNVPAHIDTDTLIKMLSDRDVLKALTTNKDFQDLDANVKSKIQARINRSRGV